MQLAVISDTHLNSTPAWLDRVYTRFLESADAIIHCGDITSEATWSYFLQHPNFHAVRGNCDWAPELGHLPQFLDIELNGIRVGAAHGWGPRSMVPQEVSRHFGPEYDLVCYGHTHARDWSIQNGVQLCNPGSLGESGSLALITIGTDGDLSCEFHTVDNY